MMDTVLNLGLNDDSVEGLAARTGNERFAWDSYRRLVQMFGDVVRGVPGARFEDEIARIKRERGVTLDTELDADALRELTRRFQALYDFPTDPREQLEQAIRAVFDSWMGERAVAYRRINDIPDDWGTAVNVQQMVFGNKGPTSGSGVAFSRDEVTGAPEPSGDFLIDAQGEDVVSGVRTPRDLSELRDWMPEAHAQLLEILRTLERHYGDMQDTEFTIEEGRLYMLQTRNAKRPAQAAVRFAVDAVDEGLLTRARRRSRRSTPRSLDALLHPTFDPDARLRGRRARRRRLAGRGQGRDRVHRAGGGRRRRGRARDVILVRPFTEADDVAGFHAAKGILTSEGGKASHAALVARGMGRPAVTGAGDAGHRPARPRGAHRRARPARGRPDRDRRHDRRHHARRRPARHARGRPALRHACSAGATSCARSACAPTPTRPRTRAARAPSAPRASACAAPSTCSWPPTASRRCSAMIMADDEAGRRAALDELLPLQQDDFEGMFEAMEGLPVTIRLLDPPLHEFLPDRFELVEQVTEARLRGAPELAALEHTLERVRALEEGNPMLGTRGVRLGLIHPEIYEMQARAIFRAARAVRERTGHAPARRDHDPARRLRARARAGARPRAARRPSRRASRPVATSASAR